MKQRMLNVKPIVDYTMEKRKLRKEYQCHHNHGQILDVTNHMNTLIQVGYPSELPPAQNSSAFQRNRKIYPRHKAVTNEEALWRRWHSNVHGSNNQLDNYPRKPNNGLSREHLSWTDNQEFKSDSNVMKYNSMYTGTMAQPQTYNGARKHESTILAMKERGSFKNYCEHCTIHGLKYVGDKHLPKCERIFWMLSVLLALCGAAYFIWNLYNKFSTSPIIISRSSHSVSIDEIPFPSLTICNMNMAKKSLANQVLQGKDELQHFLLDDVCNIDSDMSSVSSEVKKEASNWTLRSKFIQKASPSCSDILYYCRWNTNVTDCNDIFKSVYTDEGVCCNFNSVKEIQWKARKWSGFDISWTSYDYVDWNPEYVFSKRDAPSAIPWRGRSSGVSHGLTLALDVQLNEYYCSSTASVGFKMLLHSPVEMPRMSDYGFTLSPGKETRVIITPQITDAEKNIQKIPLKIRKCYFLNERRLRYYRTYTEGNCQLECEANFTLDMCKCMQYYMPVEEGTKICSRFEDECTNLAKRLMTDNLEDNDDNVTAVSSCKCYPGCHEIYYSTEISHSMLMGTFEVGHEFMKNNATYFEKNVAIVHVFYVDTSHIKYTKNEIYGFVELLSNTGGLLGLFMGFSLLSVMEIVYYILLWIGRKILKKKDSTNDKTDKLAAHQIMTNRRDALYPFAQ